VRLEVVQRLPDPDHVHRLAPSGEDADKILFDQGNRAGQDREFDPGQVERRAGDVDAGVAADVGASQRSDAGRCVAAGQVEKAETGRRLGQEHVARAPVDFAIEHVVEVEELAEGLPAIQEPCPPAKPSLLMGLLLLAQS